MQNECLEVCLELFFKVFFICKYIKIISIYFFKNTFNINLLKWCENINLKEKNLNFFKSNFKTLNKNMLVSNV